MALQWEAKWEDVIVEEYGIRLRVKRDRVTGLYACPICGIGDHASYFFTVKDLLVHIASHALRDWKRERVVVKEVGVEEGEQHAQLMEDEE